jgi:hypothetical protein
VGLATQSMRKTKPASRRGVSSFVVAPFLRGGECKINILPVRPQLNVYSAYKNALPKTIGRSLSLVVKIKQAHSRARNTAAAFILLLLGTHNHFLRVHILLGRKDWFDCSAMLVLIQILKCFCSRSLQLLKAARKLNPLYLQE